MDNAMVEVKPKEIELRHSPEEMIDDFIASLDVSTMSRDTYTRSLKPFLSWLYDTNRLSLALQREDILAYKEYLAKSKAAYTVSLYLTTVRKLYQWLESRRLYPDITRGIKGGKKPRGFRKDMLSQEQLREALDAMERLSLEGLRNYAIFNLMARTALRDVEVCRAQVGDIRQETGQPVLWIQGKGRDSKDDYVILTPKALKPIKAYLKARGAVKKEEPLFCSHSDRNQGQALTSRSISRIIKTALRAVGMDDSRLTAHSLRHTAISLSIQKGASLQQAQAMARHSDSKTTLTYFHNLQRIEAGAEKYIDF